MIVVVVGFLGIAYSGGGFDHWWQVDMYRSEYQELFIADAVLISKVTIMILSVFFAITFNSKSHENLSKYTIQNSQDRLRFIASSIITLLAFLILIVLVYCLFLAIYLRHHTPFIISSTWILSLGKGLLVMGLFYSSLIGLLTMLIRNGLVGLSSFIIFFLLEANQPHDIMENGYETVFIYRIFPHVILQNSEPVLLESIVIYLILILILFCLMVVYFLMKDIL